MLCARWLYISLEKHPDELQGAIAEAFAVDGPRSSIASWRLTMTWPKLTIAKIKEAVTYVTGR